MLKPLPIKTEPCPFCGTTCALTKAESSLHQQAKLFRTDVSGIGPFCVEFPDGEIITTRSEKRQKLIAQAALPLPAAQEALIPGFAQILRLVRSALTGEPNLYSQSRFLAEKLVELGFPKQSGYLMDIIDSKGKAILPMSLEQTCTHDRLNEDGICRSCGVDRRGI